MYIKAKYPKTERWYMNIETQGYGSGKQQNNSTIDMAAITRNNENVKTPVWNAIDQHTGTYANTRTPDTYSHESTNTWPDKPVDAPTFELELWGILNEGGNRDSGNNLSYIDENGDAQSQFVGNNGSSFAWLSTTEYEIASATGDPYTIRRLAKGETAIEATGYDLVTGFALQNEFDDAFAAGESEATVQAEYDAA